MAKAKTPEPGADPAPVRYYKILKGGRSYLGGVLKWSLPKGDRPGKWHEVEGPLVQCKNGLHLTSQVSRFVAGRVWQKEGFQVYEAEPDGETIGPFNGYELVCRKVRLLRDLTGTEELAAVLRAEQEAQAEAEKRSRAEQAEREAQSLAEEKARAAQRRAENREWRAKKKAEEEAKESPAYALLTHAWRETAGGSWDRLNGAMQDALVLAITAGMRFNPGDFKAFAEDFNSGRWTGDGERYYALACGLSRRAHGGNPSAVQSYEQWRCRKPFLVIRSPSDPVKVRLCVGETFDWHIGLKERVRGVTVTSFVDRPPGDKPPYIVACTYKNEKAVGNTYTRKVDRVFKIIHDMIAEYHKAVRDHAKAREAAEAAPTAGGAS